MGITQVILETGSGYNNITATKTTRNQALTEELQKNLKTLLSQRKELTTVSQLLNKTVDLFQ